MKSSIFKRTLIIHSILQLQPLMSQCEGAGEQRPGPLTVLGSCSLYSWFSALASYGSFTFKVRSLEATSSYWASLLLNVTSNLIPNALTCCCLHTDNTERDLHALAVHSATEWAYFWILKHCQSDFGNVGIAFVAVAPVAVVLVALAVFVAVAGCIPQCFAAGR